MQRSRTVKRTLSILTVTQPSTQYRVSAHLLEKSQTSIIYEWRWNRKTACTVVCTIITHFHLYYSCSVHFRRRHHRILYKLTKTLLISFSSQFIQIINFNFVFVCISFFLFPWKSTFRLIQGSSTDLDTNFIADENAWNSFPILKIDSVVSTPCFNFIQGKRCFSLNLCKTFLSPRRHRRRMQQSMKKRSGVQIQFKKVKWLKLAQSFDRICYCILSHHKPSSNFGAFKFPWILPLLL